MKNIKLNCDILEKLPENFYTNLLASPLQNPKLVSVNKEFAKELGLNNEDIESKEFINFINGDYLANGSNPYANAYSGHQFGYSVPNLGDGRALNLGKLNNYYLQLKGSGLTPYSRDGDGRAVLRSSIREYLISEAMQGLGIPTTRALGLITSDTRVLREYKQEQGAIVLRASTSWIRFGSFEYAYMQKNKKESLTQLADFVIQESYSQFKNCKNKYEEMYFAIVDKTVEMIALWQSVGFMHGVMNTDNMNIEGLTIDYGPYAFMENFDRQTICNKSDYEGRYNFENQPFIAQWNLSVLAKVLSPIADENLMNNYNDLFIGKFKKRYFSIMGEKLGFKEEHQDDYKFISQLIELMENNQIDYTPFFYNLSYDNIDELLKLSNNQEAVKNWLNSYKERLNLENSSKKERLVSMQKINPKYVLKNYMLQEAIQKAEIGNFSGVDDLLKIAKSPYNKHEEFEKYSKKTPIEISNITCSCSS